MPPVSIENPILNSPFAERARHFRFDEVGITSEIADWVGKRMTDRVREQVGGWRSARYPGITAVTRELLAYLVAIPEAESRAHLAHRPRLRAVRQEVDDALRDHPWDTTNPEWT